MRNRTFFDIAVHLFIILLLLANVAGAVILKENGIDLDDIPLLYIAWVFLLEWMIIFYVIQNNYAKPIRELNKHINDFLVWNIKDKKIKIKTSSLNPNVKTIFNFFDIILNSLKNIKEEFLSGKAIKWEVQLATELQEKLLNKKLEHIPSLDVVAKSRPAWEIGWDSYDIIHQDENFYIYVWDATGHGVGAWFVMVMVNALVSGFAKIFKSWSQILSYTNEILKPRIKSNILMSLLMIRWNETEKRLFMTWAWHEYLMIYKNELKKCFLVKSGGTALWMTKNIHKILKEQEIKFEKHDIAVLYTDGITEAINQNKKDGNEQMFGEARLQKAIENAPNLPGKSHKSARSVFNNITIELSRFMGYKNVQLDDITLVVVHYKWDDIIENDVNIDIPWDFITEWNWNN